MANSAIFVEFNNQSNCKLIFLSLIKYYKDAFFYENFIMKVIRLQEIFMGNMGVWQLLILAVIVVLLFGTKKLRNLGGDLGSAIKGFKSAISEDKEKPTDTLADKSENSSAVKTETKDKDQA